MRVVFDTSVLVAAAHSRRGASFALVSSVPSSRFEICLSVPLFTEWQDVLTRPEHLPPGLSAHDALVALRALAAHAHLQEIYYLWRPFLGDPTTTWCWSWPSLRDAATLSQTTAETSSAHPSLASRLSCPGSFFV